MIQYKKIIMTLVALFAISTGAWADETPIVTITATGSGPAYSVEGIVTLETGSAGYGAGYGWVSGPTNNLTVTAADGVTITKVKFIGNQGGSWEDTESPFQVLLQGFYVKNASGTKIGSDDGVTSIEVYGTIAPAGPTVSGPTIVEGKPQWTFAMPAGNVELQVEYYPGMLTLPASLTGGTLEVVGLGLGTTSFTAPSGWNQNSTRLASNHFEGFKSVTEEEAKAWPGVPATGLVALYYNYDETAQKWDMIYFKDGAFDAIYKGVYQQLATIYNLPGFGYSVFYTTGMQMPAGFEKDEEGNIYVAKDTKFTVKAVPAEGYHLVGWSDDATNKELEREFTMGDDDFILTATFSDEYDLAFEAANANTIESGKATVTVGGTAATVTEGKLEGVKMDSKVTVTAKDGYKFRKVEGKKTGSAVLAPALENGATVVIICNWGYDTTTFTYTNNGGTFSGQASGYDAGYFYNGLELNGKNLSFSAWDVDNSEYLSVGITFNTESSAYSYTGKGEDFVSFTISVNGTDVTDQLSELK